MVTEETVSRPAPRVVTATVRARFDAAPAVVFDAIAGADVLPRLFKGYGLVAGIVGTSDQVGSWDRPGSTHVVRMSDGGTALETITHYEPSRRYAYRVTDFTLAVRHVAAYATGDWTLEPDGLGTRLTCIYTMHAKNRLAEVGLLLFAKYQWLGFLRVGFDNARRLTERGAAAVPASPRS